MAGLTFYGGIHPYDGKELSRDCAVQTLFPENGEMVFPLVQHIGRPSIPIVNIGDRVRTGQLIAVAEGELSANLHSSVSGRVVAIEPRRVVGGGWIPSIVIDNDGLYLEVVYPENRRLETLNKETVLRTIQAAGIVGMGGSGIPTQYKLQNAGTADIDTVIANCVECEPYLTSDYRRILENPWKIINGLMIMLTVFPRARGFIAVSENNVEGYHLLRDLLKDNDRIYVKRLRNKYPQGSERQLIYALTGRTLNAKMLPYDIGCVVQNTDTLVAINQAVIMHEPLITRIVTVSGDGVREPGNFRVRIGMSCRDILEQAGGLKPGLTRRSVLILDEGPMMGSVIDDLDVPVTKLTSGIIVMVKDNIPYQEETPCTRCGRCVDACPNNLNPLVLEKDVTKGNDQKFIDHNGLECCGCGCCSYICPSKIQLSARIYAKKRAIMQNPAMAGDYARRFTR